MNELEKLFNTLPGNHRFIVIEQLTTMLIELMLPHVFHCYDDHKGHEDCLLADPIKHSDEWCEALKKDLRASIIATAKASSIELPHSSVNEKTRKEILEMINDERPD